MADDMAWLDDIMDEAERREPRVAQTPIGLLTLAIMSEIPEAIYPDRAELRRRISLRIARRAARPTKR